MLRLASGAGYAGRCRGWMSVSMKASAQGSTLSTSFYGRQLSSWTSPPPVDKSNRGTARKRPVYLQNVRKGLNPYQTPQRSGDITVVHRYPRPSEVTEDRLLFERAPSLVTQIAGPMVRLHILAVGAFGVFYTLSESIDPHTIAQKFMLSLAAFGLSTWFALSAQKHLSRSVLRLRVLKGGYFEITKPPSIP